MSAAHETPTLEPSQERVFLVRRLDCFGHGTHQLRGESRWLLRGWCCHLDGSATQVAHHTSRTLGSAAIWKRRRCVLITGSPSCRRQSGRTAQSEQPLLSGGRPSCARSLRPNKKRKLAHRGTRAQVFFCGCWYAGRISDGIAVCVSYT